MRSFAAAAFALALLPIFLVAAGNVNLDIFVSELDGPDTKIRLGSDLLWNEYTMPADIELRGNKYNYVRFATIPFDETGDPEKFSLNTITIEQAPTEEGGAAQIDTVSLHPRRARSG